MFNETVGNQFQRNFSSCRAGIALPAGKGFCEKVDNIMRFIFFCAFGALFLQPAVSAFADAWTLEKYKSEVFKASHDIKKADEDSEIYKKKYISDLAAFYLPTLTLSASDNPYSVYNNPKWRLNKGDVTAGAAASLNLFNNFKDKLSLDSSFLSREIYDSRLWQEKQRVALNAMNIYYSVLRKKRLLEVVRASLKSYQEQYDKVRIYYKDGMKSYSDLLKSELNVRSSQLSEATSLEDYRNSVMDFNLAVYRDPETEVEPEDFINYSTGSLSGLRKDSAYALRSRPELNIAHLELRRSELASKKAFIDQLPDFSVDAYYNRQGLGSLGKPSAGVVNPAYSMKLSLSIPLGPATLSDAQAAFEAKTSLERAKRSLYDTELLVKREAVSSWLALDTALKRYEVSNLKAGISKQNLEIVNAKYNEGRSGIVELADAQSDDLSSQSELANALYDLLLAKANYDKAEGRQLW